MPFITVELIQGREAIERMRKAGGSLPALIHKAIRQAGELVRGSAITNIQPRGAGPSLEGGSFGTGPKTLRSRTGRLRKSITMRSTGGGFETVAEVGPGPLSYAAIHEFGGTTPPHVIVPATRRAKGKAGRGGWHGTGKQMVTGKVLAFQVGGRMVFARRVNHPGSRIPSRPYMRPALTDNIEKIRLLFQRAIMPALKGEGKTA